MMQPWPFMRRGTECTVPMPPGLVSEIVVPWKSAAVSLLPRARVTRSSYAARYSLKVSVSARLMLGHHERAGAVGLGQVDRDAEVDVRRGDDRRLAVDLGVEHVLARELLERLDQRPADEVGEADLAAAGARHVVVDDDAVVDHQLRRDRAHARRGRDGERLVHVGGEGLGHAAEDGDLVVLGGSRRLPTGAAVGAWAGIGCGRGRAWRSCAPRAASR